MDLRSACLATAKLYRRQAELEPERRDDLLAEADKWTRRAETQLRLAIRIEQKDMSAAHRIGAAHFGA